MVQAEDIVFNFTQLIKMLYQYLCLPQSLLSSVIFLFRCSARATTRSVFDASQVMQLSDICYSTLFVHNLG